jgi:hypothetical protein
VSAPGIVANTLIGALIRFSSASVQRAIHKLNSPFHFVASSTSIPGGAGGEDNKVVYRVTISLTGNQDEVGVAHLIDEFDVYCAAMSAVVLLSDALTLISLRRGPNRDRALGEVPVGTPFDAPITIRPERIGYQNQLRQQKSPAGIHSCQEKVRPQMRQYWSSNHGPPKKVFRVHELALLYST